MKAYISGKITGDENFMDKFLAEQKKLEADGYEVVNPTVANCFLPKSTTWEQYMEMSIVMLRMADVIVMLPDWKDSKGACLEYGYALASNKIMIFENDLSPTIMSVTTESEVEEC